MGKKFWIQPFGSRPEEGKTYLFNGIKKKKSNPFQPWVLSLKATSWLLANPSQLLKVISLSLFCPRGK